MTAHRPLVRSGGKTTQLPAGDSLLGVPTYIPAITQAGAILRLELSLTNYTLPVVNQAGSTLSIAVVING